MKLIFFYILVVLSSISWAQTGVSMLQMGDQTFQNSFYNPAWMPQETVSVGLPLLGGVSVMVSNRFSYSDIVGKSLQGEAQFKPDRLSDRLGRRNYLSLDATVDLFHLGINMGSAGSIGLSARERIGLEISYPQHLYDWMVYGNADYLGRKVNLHDLRVAMTHMREYGLAYAVHVKRHRLKAGVRVKLYQGFFNVSTPESFRAVIETSPRDYHTQLSTRALEIRSAGASMIGADLENMSFENPQLDRLAKYLYKSGNLGMGLDLGVDKQITSQLRVSVSANDLGFIRWKDAVLSMGYEDRTYVYRGVDTNKGGSIINSVVDTLSTRFESQTRSREYLTMVKPTLVGNVKYRPEAWGGGMEFSGFLTSRISPKATQFHYGVGVLKAAGKYVLVSVNANKAPQQNPNIGAALVANVKPVQIYFATDKIIGFDARRIRWTQARAGINFVFPLSGKSKYTRPSVTTRTFIGRDVKVKEVQGIYTTIRRQKRAKTPRSASGNKRWKVKSKRKK